MTTDYSRPKKYEPFKFLAISDLHVQDDGTSNRDSIKQYIMEYSSRPANKVKAVLMVGDLTDSATTAQCDQFISNWVTPLVTAGVAVYPCLGNHDAPKEGNRNPKIVEFVDDVLGDAYCSSFDIESIHFVTCYLHPMHWQPDMLLTGEFWPRVLTNSLLWMEADMWKHRNKKMVLFWHFNCDGQFSEWWFNWEKNATYKLIKNFDIQQIFVGHWHSTNTLYWGKSKLRVSCVGGGKKVAHASVDAYGNVTMKYVDVTSGITYKFDDIVLRTATPTLTHNSAENATDLTKGV